MSKHWVVNASPLIVLGQVDRIDLLTELCDNLVIPTGVSDEVLQGDENDPSVVWLNKRGRNFVKLDVPIPTSVSSWDLGKGETTVLSWALHHPGYEIIVDDRAARNCGVALGIPARGTLGILLLAKKAGLIDRVEPVMQEIVATGFHMHDRLYMDVLRIAGEKP